jgi:hypothetical protein
MTVRTIPAVEARVHFGEIMQKSFKNGDRFVVEKSGIPMVVILNADDYSKLVGEREERFRVLDKIRAKLPRFSAEEVESDVSKAITQVRKKKPSRA